MEKIASDKVAQVLSAVPGMLRNLATERDGLLEKNASLEAKVAEYERQQRVDSIAKTAGEKGIDSLGETHEEKVASLENALAKGKSLDVMEEAVKLSSVDASFGNLGDDIAPGNGQTQLESYLLGHLG